MSVCNLAKTIYNWFNSWIFNVKEQQHQIESSLFISLSVPILLACLLLWAFKNSKPKVRLPPGPLGLPIVGYLPFIRHNMHQLFMQLAQKYGPIYKLSIGQKLCVVVSSQTLIREIVRQNDITFANRIPSVAAKTFSYGGNDIAFAPYGPEWRVLRKIFVREMQSNANLESFYPLRRNKVRKSVKDLFEKKSGKAINFGELIFLTIINMMSGMFWGATLDGEEEISVGAKFRSATAELVQILGKPNVSDLFPFLARFDIQGVEREMKEASQKIEDIYDYVIDKYVMKKELTQGKEKVEVNKERKDFMHFLLEFKDQETGRSISRQQIKGLLMNSVIGGTDTSSRTVEWTMTELMLHPQMLKKAQQELTKVVGANNLVEESHIQELPYLHAIVKEALRFHPVAPLLLPRCPKDSCNVGGYTIPKGATVFLNAWALHKDPEFWDNPTEFEPARFLDGKGSELDYNGNHLQYLPFGSGRRVCAGLPLAERMVMYVMATFLHMFNWELPNGEKPDTSEKFGIVHEKATPLMVIPTPRLSNLALYA
ncbi:hypothetical protein JCGZ_20762 [Jatropha curcas]|uniref:Cytochrome P450 n=1 Tax=Jatropha curcas TaxID=180498 RepID=A0A067JNP8_JATCU|nr:flavonoid 3'-monooxygenase CYP75B137 [Jatropha curcas]KDP25606.1 hypothetical protein JCGZ_20762 [Jatropha curcas]